MNIVTELDIRLRLDPSEPSVAGNCTLTQTVGGTPCVVVRDLQRVDELKLGHLVAMLLVNHELDSEDALIEFDRSRRTNRSGS